MFCLEASRLARNGRGWHHLLELCGLVGAYVVDADGIYDPATPNDRLLLGLKGTMSEFELTLLRKRMLEAAVAKAKRGELRLPVPLYGLSAPTPGPDDGPRLMLRPLSSHTRLHVRASASREHEDRPHLNTGIGGM